MYGKALEIKPMKAKFLPKGKEHMRKEICESGEYFGQIKKDGAWYIFEKDIEGNCFLFSRVISKQTGHLSEKSANVPHIIDLLNDQVPNGTILVGEIYYPNGKSNDVTKIMGCKPEKAIKRQLNEYELIHYYIFDILAYNGRNFVEEKLTNWERQEFLQNLKNNLTNDYIQVADNFTKNLNKLIDEAIESGEEGVVLKKKDGLYIPDKAPMWNWIKFKCEDEADVICMGFEPPEKEYTGKELETWGYFDDDGTPVTKAYYNGWIGAIKIGVYKNGELSQIGTVSSGLTEEILKDIKTNPKKYIGQPLSVKFMEAYKDGTLRHPIFVRWRGTDINEEDCTWEKIFK